jgi:hypothetical protein
MLTINCILYRGRENNSFFIKLGHIPRTGEFVQRPEFLSIHEVTKVIHTKDGIELVLKWDAAVL